MKRTSVSTETATGGDAEQLRRPSLASAGCAVSTRQSATVAEAAAKHRADRALVQQLLAGDASAWQRFVETHGRLVRARVADVASAFGRSQDESAIDDATAEVFAALLGNNGAALRAFAGRSSLGTYVAVIATRSATRGFARRHHASAHASDPGLAQTARDPSTPDPVSELIEAEQQERLRHLLDRLPPKQRVLITLFHLKGRSYAEISEQMEIPIGSIGPTLRRAEAKLRQWMEAD